jgi:hypothetical protein
MALGVSAMAVYVAGAAALAELGVRRILPGNRRLRRWSGSVALVAGLIFAVAAAALAGEEPAGPVAVRFETHVTDPAAGVFLVICHNASDQPVHVLLPLPLDGAVTPEGPVYGARLYIRERGGDAFRLLERAGPWWQGEAGAGAGPDSIDVPPHAVADFTFRARRLAREGVEPEAIRLAYLREDGVVVDEFEHAFSERLTAPARQTRRARPSPAPSAVPRAQPAPQPRSAAPEERPAAARRRPGPPAPPIEVRYVGRINDRVVLNVRQGLASAQRVTAAKGDEIAPDWLLHDVDAAARLAVLRHSATGAEAVAGARRGWVELPASE